MNKFRLPKCARARNLFRVIAAARNMLSMFLLFLFSLGEAAKIAVVSYNLGTSHLMFAGAIADTLVDAGHTVHFFQVQQDDMIRTNGSARAHRHILIPSVAHNIWNDMAFRYNPFKKFLIETPSFFINATRSFDQSCHDVLAQREFLEKLGREEKYDIGISEAYGFHGFGLLYILGVREYMLSAGIPFQPAFASFFNIPTPISYVTSCLDAEGSLEAPDLSYFRRVYNTALHAMNYWIYERWADKHTAIFRKFYPEMPHLEDLVKSSSLILVNTASLLEMPRPTTHKVLHIGGIAESVKRQKKPLPDDIMRVVNGTRPVVVVSFGTLARTIYIQGELLMAFLNAFARFPDYDFIWKFDEAEIHADMFDKYPNVYTYKWLPQKQLLNHRNTRAFITHCGLNSLIESAHAGVPMVAVPLFTDQQYNAAVARRRRIAVYVDKVELSEQTIGDALHAVLREKSYARNSLLVQAQLRAFPRQPKRELTEFVDYVHRFGAPRGGMFELPPQSFILTNSLDIYIPATAAAVVAAGLFAFYLAYLYGDYFGIVKIKIEVTPIDEFLERFAGLDDESEDEWDRKHKEE